MFGQHQAGVIGRMHQHSGQGFVRPYALAGTQSNAWPRGVSRIMADREQCIGLPVGIEHHQRGQQFGERRRSAAHVEIATPKQLAIQHGGIGGRCAVIGVVAVGERPGLGAIECAQQRHSPQQRAQQRARQHVHALRPAGHPLLRLQPA